MSSDEKITIRTARESDAPALLAIYAPYVENTAITFEYDVPSIEEFTSRIHHTLEKYPYLVAEKNSQILGYAYASPFHERAAYDWAAETSIYVDQNCKHMGIGRLLHDALEQTLKAQGILNMNACIAYTPSADAHLDNNSVEFHSHRDQTVFTQSLHGKFRHFHRHLFVIKPLSVFFNSRAACADHTGKRDLFQIARDKSPASSGAQPRLMSVFP